MSPWCSPRMTQSWDCPAPSLGSPLQVTAPPREPCWAGDPRDPGGCTIPPQAPWDGGNDREKEGDNQPPLIQGLDSHLALLVSLDFRGCHCLSFLKHERVFFLLPTPLPGRAWLLQIPNQTSQQVTLFHLPLFICLLSQLRGDSAVRRGDVHTDSSVPWATGSLLTVYLCPELLCLSWLQIRGAAKPIFRDGITGGGAGRRWAGD